MKKNQWYKSQNLKPQGPYSLEEMRSFVMRGEVRPHDLIMNEEQGAWSTAESFSEFEQGLFPAEQGMDPVQGFSVEEKEWIVLMPHAEKAGLQQEGPFSINEMKELMSKGALSPEQYAWKSGLSGWCRLQDRPEFNL